MPTFSDPVFSSDYNGLCNAVADTLNRDDLVTQVPIFVKLATARIRRDMARLRHPYSRTTLSYTGGTALAAAKTTLPTDFMSADQITPADALKTFEQRTPDEMKQLEKQNFPSGTNPAYYAIVGRQLWVLPAPTASATFACDLDYFASLPDLDTSNETNWALTRYPDLYLYGALAHSAPFVKADERIALWDGLYRQILTDIETETAQATRQQSKLVAQRRSF